MRTREQSCKMIAASCEKSSGAILAHSSRSWRTQGQEASVPASKCRRVLTHRAHAAATIPHSAGCWYAEFLFSTFPSSWPSHSLHVPQYPLRRQAFQWFLFVTVPTDSQTRFFIHWEPSSTFVTSGANRTTLPTTFYCVNGSENSCFSLDSRFSRSFTLSLFPHKAHGPWRQKAAELGSGRRLGPAVGRDPRAVPS